MAGGKHRARVVARGQEGLRPFPPLLTSSLQALHPLLVKEQLTGINMASKGPQCPRKRCEEEREKGGKKEERDGEVEEEKDTVLAMSGPLERTMRTVATGDLWDLSKGGTFSRR